MERHEHMALGILDLEKAHDTVPRDMAMATLRCMGIAEAVVRMVESTYEETKDRVVCGPRISEEFRVDVGLRQGSALSPLLFIAVVEVISRKASTRDIFQPVAIHCYQSPHILTEYNKKIVHVLTRTITRVLTKKTKVCWDRYSFNIFLNLGMWPLESVKITCSSGRQQYHHCACHGRLSERYPAHTYNNTRHS